MFTSSSSPAAVVVAAAIVDDQRRLLAAQRARPAALAGKWELPGGKVENGETEAEALVRECREELGVTIVVGERAAADAATVGVEGVLRIYWACIDGPTPPQPLDHVALRWLRADEMDSVDWLPGDLPAVAEIKQVLLSS